MSGLTLLCIDSSTAVASVGLVVDGETRAERRMDQKRRHAEQMYESIDAVLSDAGVNLGDVDALAVGLGPGSFIGVRVALATAKGLAIGADLPLIGVSTLAAIALSHGAAGRIAVAIDAKKGQVYAGLYDVEALNEPAVELIAPQAIDPGPCAAQLEAQRPLAALLGDGPARFAEAFAPLDDVLRGSPPPQPAALYALAAERTTRREFDDPAALAPFYARRSEAELKREASDSASR